MLYSDVLMVISGLLGVWVLGYSSSFLITAVKKLSEHI